MNRSALRVLGVAAALLAGFVPPAPAQGPRTPGAVHGVVLDAQTGQPVPGASVRLRELGRAERSHADGTFHFEGVAPGRYVLAAERIGYAPAEAPVAVAAGAAAEVTLRLRSTAIQVEGVVAAGTGRERGAQESAAATTVVSGAALRRRLAATVPATLAAEPGVSVRSNGPGAGQPVIRGLSGDRVLVLEDGQRTGDIAGSAADHGVTVDPLTAERVEVVRGPAGLLYGSNSLGGVVNVVREEVPRSLPDRLAGSVALQGESASGGVAAGGSVLGAVGGFALRGEANVRHAGDVRTPEGDLPRTGIEGWSAGAGASRVWSRGHAGLSLRDQSLVYGVPGEFRGREIPGAHPGGADIDIRRTTLRGRAAALAVGPFDAVEADVSLSRFRQEEQTTGDDGAAFTGTSFHQRLGTVNVVARHAHREGLLASGAVGVHALARELDAAGLATGSRSSRQFSGAVFAHEELRLGRWSAEIGGRWDVVRAAPRDDRPVEGVPVEERTFHGLSAGAAVMRRLGGGVQAGARLSRSFRAPSVEELYSRGPHLAAFAYEIGNPRLDAEAGTGVDLFVRASRPGVEGEVTVFRNAVDGFIHYLPTGELDPRFGRYPVYRAAAEDALLTGVEGKVQVEPYPGWAVEATGSLVRGTLRDGGGPLPLMPPARGGLRLRRDVPAWFVEAGVDAAAAQRRVARDRASGDPLETPTDGHLLLNAAAGLRLERGGRLHTLTLVAENLADETWRDHLSRTKAVVPQPGINVRLLYRVDL